MTSKRLRVPRCGRGGTTLVEVLANMAVMSLILSTLAVSLHRVYRADVQVRDELAVGANIARLSGQFRRDAHSAISAENQIEQDADKLVLQLPAGETVEYVWAGRSLQRTHNNGDQILHRDSFRLAKDSQISIETTEHEDVRFVTLAIRAETAAGNDEADMMQIQAAIGLDHIHSGGGQ